MNCEKIKEKLSLYIDGQLDENECSIVEEHLKSCVECKTYYEELLKLGYMVDDFDIDGDKSYWESQASSVIDKIEEAEKENIVPIPQKKLGNEFYRYAAVAAAVMVVAFVTIYESIDIDPSWELFESKKEQPIVVSSPSVPADDSYSDEDQLAEVVIDDELESGDVVKPMVKDEKSVVSKKSTTSGETKERTRIGDSEIEKAKEAIVDKSNTKITRTPEMEQISEIVVKPKSEKTAPKKGIPLPEPESVKSALESSAGVTASADDAEMMVRSAIPVASKDILADTKSTDKGKKGRSVQSKSYDFLETPEETAEIDKIESNNYDSLKLIVAQIEKSASSKKYYRNSGNKSKSSAEKMGANIITTNTSASAPSILNQLDVATAYYNLGKVTDDKTERERMIDNLEKLLERADSSHVDSITVLINDLESIED